MGRRVQHLKQEREMIKETLNFQTSQNIDLKANVITLQQGLSYLEKRFREMRKEKCDIQKIAQRAIINKQEDREGQMNREMERLWWAI